MKKSVDNNNNERKIDKLSESPREAMETSKAKKSNASHNPTSKKSKIQFESVSIVKSANDNGARIAGHENNILVSDSSKQTKLMENNSFKSISTGSTAGKNTKDLHIDIEKGMISINPLNKSPIKSPSKHTQPLSKISIDTLDNSSTDTTSTVTHTTTSTTNNNNNNEDYMQQLLSPLRSNAKLRELLAMPLSPLSPMYDIPAYEGSSTTALLNPSNNNSSSNYYNNLNQSNKSNSSVGSGVGGYRCFICWETSNSQENMVAPCKCKNVHLKYAHRDCIERWINETQKTHCNVCMAEYPVKLDPIPWSDVIRRHRLLVLTLLVQFCVPLVLYGVFYSWGILEDVNEWFIIGHVFMLISLYVLFAIQEVSKLNRYYRRVENFRPSPP